MKIQFINRDISKGPIKVLTHLYYYRAQYGISVKQITGQHQDYWRKLPTQLGEAKDNPKVLNSIIKELENIAEGSEERLKKMRSQVKGKWEEKEIVLNAQLLSVLCALPEKLLAMTFKNLVKRNDIPEKYRIVDLYIKGIKGEDTDFVEPDLLLLGNNHLSMVEIKTRGGENSSRSYPPKQLLNYIRLVSECQNSDDKQLPTCFLHLILVPTTDLHWLENNKEWVRNYDKNTGLLSIDFDMCIKLGKKSSWNISYERIYQLLKETPIYYFAWEHLVDAFKSSINELDDKHYKEHWERIGTELSKLAKRTTKYI
jgi:hypothetical protein